MTVIKIHSRPLSWPAAKELNSLDDHLYQCSISIKVYSYSHQGNENGIFSGMAEVPCLYLIGNLG